MSDVTTASASIRSQDFYQSLISHMRSLCSSVTILLSSPDIEWGSLMAVMMIRKGSPSGTQISSVVLAGVLVCSKVADSGDVVMGIF